MDDKEHPIHSQFLYYPNKLIIPYYSNVLIKKSQCEKNTPSKKTFHKTLILLVDK